MIYFISDLHGGKDVGSLEKYEKNRNKGDLLIILGDVGVKFNKDGGENIYFDQYFLSRQYPILMIDGNHENFDYLYSCPKEKAYGGEVHKLTDSIIHLCRGEIFTIEGKTFLVMGGCKSTQKWKDLGLWWEAEEPTPEEIARARENLAARGNKVDYVLTHKHKRTNADENDLTLGGFIEYVEKNVEYKHWYSGHWHAESHPDEKHTVVYDTPIQLK